MAGNLTDYAEGKLLEHLVGKTAFTMPTGTTLALFTVAPSDTGGGTEVSGGGYARTSITWGAQSAGSISNSADIVFPTASANWGAVVAVAVFDTAGTPNMLVQGGLSASKTINSGDVFRIQAANLTVTLD